jgi:hypothetical protein
MVLPATGSLPEVLTSRLELIGESTHTGSALLATVNEEERGALEDAIEFLRGELSDGAHHQVKELVRLAKASGISDRTLRRARRSIGAKTEKAGFGRGWEWFLPSSVAKWPSPPATSTPPDVWPLRTNGSTMQDSDALELLETSEGARHGGLATSEQLAGADALVLDLASQSVSIDEIAAFTHVSVERVRDLLTPTFAETAEATRRLQALDGGSHGRPITEVIAEVARMRREERDA